MPPSEPTPHCLHACPVIRSFRDQATADVFAEKQTRAARRLEALKGVRRGQHSIRINDQFRVCFRWVDGGAEDVEIVDYH